MNPINLREKRKELGMTLEQVAELVGSTPAYISMIERGMGQPSDEILIKLSETYQVDVLDIFLSFNKVPPFVAKEIQEHDSLREAIKLIRDLPEKGREKLYEKLFHLHSLIKGISEKVPEL